MSLWYLLLVKTSKNPWGKSDMSWMITWNYPIKRLFLLATVPMITLKISFSHFHNSNKETYSFIKIMQPISPNNNWENGVKQIKITEENLPQSCLLWQLPKKIVKNVSKFFFIFTTICLISAEWMWFIYMSCFS